MTRQEFEQAVFAALNRSGVAHDLPGVSGGPWIEELANSLGIPLSPLSYTDPNFDPAPFLWALHTTGVYSPVPVYVTEIMLGTRRNVAKKSRELGHEEGSLERDMLLMTAGYYLGVLTHQAGLAKGVEMGAGDGSLSEESPHAD